MPTYIGSEVAQLAYNLYMYLTCVIQSCVSAINCLLSESTILCPLTWYHESLDLEALAFITMSSMMPASSNLYATSTSAPSYLAASALIGDTSDTPSGVPMSQAIHNVNIKSLVPYTLDLQSHNYTKWCTLFEMVLGRFNLLPHVESNATFPSDLEWTKENLLIGNWLYSTIS
jgi:hypothetical protein